MWKFHSAVFVEVNQTSATADVTTKYIESLLMKKYVFTTVVRFSSFSYSARYVFVIFVIFIPSQGYESIRDIHQLLRSIKNISRGG
jgi:hypothetical protein